MVFGNEQRLVGPSRIRINMQRNIFEMGLEVEQINQYMQTVMRREEGGVKVRRSEVTQRNG